MTLKTHDYMVTGDGRKPRLAMPPKACETHSHIYGARDKYPPIPGREPDFGASVDAYLAMLNRLGFERCVIVQPSLYGADNRCTLDAMAQIGPARARGVAVTRTDAGDDEFKALHAAGIRGLRFFLMVDDLTLDDADAMARKVAPLGWHLQVQDDGDWLPAALPLLEKLPIDIVIDHIGRIPAATGVNDPGFQRLLRFLETGRCWVKISAPYLSSAEGPPRYADIGDRVRALVAARPDRLVWGANWPHPHHHGPDEKPEEADDLDVLLDWVPDAGARKAILADNAAVLYDFDD